MTTPTGGPADERVVLDLHPHWKRLLVPALLVPVVVGVASYAVFLVPPWQQRSAVRWAVVAAAALVLLRGSLWPWVRWGTTRYIVTTCRVAVRTGVLARRGAEVPLTQVTAVASRRSLGDRVLRCGTLTVESGGGAARLVLRDVPRIDAVQQTLHRVVTASAAP